MLHWMLRRLLHGMLLHLGHLHVLHLRHALLHWRLHSLVDIDEGKAGIGVVGMQGHVSHMQTLHALVFKTREVVQLRKVKTPLLHLDACKGT